MMLNDITALNKERVEFKRNTILKISSFLFLCVWSWTLIDVADMTNWTLENLPVFLFVGILVFTYKKFRFGNLSYILIFIFLSLHIYGAKHIYAQTPVGFWLQEQLNTDRNHYDRIVHFLFGLLLSYPMRDLFLNYCKFSNRVSLWLPVICCLALGALYEIVEGIVVGVFFPDQGLNFLGIQGDLWDPQKDMALALLGSVMFVILFYLNKYLRRMV